MRSPRRFPVGLVGAPLGATPLMYWRYVWEHSRGLGMKLRAAQRRERLGGSKLQNSCKSSRKQQSSTYQ